ncbi:hypothetical protein F5Y16DRAFT_361438 [Xylariaceae sp. FL0255]|nr:hypothetical protein F5Y16DRAFT_361438 [Xylariaceae sp. FL0255]
MESSRPIQQPPMSAAYEVEGNAVDSTPAEQRAAHHHGHGEQIEQRSSSKQPIENATASSLGYGERGAPAGEERFGVSEEQAGRHRELEGEQMRAPGEGAVADAVRQKPGASGAQPDLAKDLDRKKREQADAREEVKAERQSGMLSEEGDVRGGVST